MPIDTVMQAVRDLFPDLPETADARTRGPQESLHVYQDFGVEPWRGGRSTAIVTEFTIPSKANVRVDTQRQRGMDLGRQLVDFLKARTAIDDMVLYRAVPIAATLEEDEDSGVVASVTFHVADEYPDEV